MFGISITSALTVCGSSPSVRSISISRSGLLLLDPAELIIGIFRGSLQMSRTCSGPAKASTSGVTAVISDPVSGLAIILTAPACTTHRAASLGVLLSIPLWVVAPIAGHFTPHLVNVTVRADVSITVPRSVSESPPRMMGAASLLTTCPVIMAVLPSCSRAIVTCSCGLSLLPCTSLASMAHLRGFLLLTICSGLRPSIILDSKKVENDPESVMAVMLVPSMSRVMIMGLSPPFVVPMLGARARFPPILAVSVLIRVGGFSRALSSSARPTLPFAGCCLIGMLTAFGPRRTVLNPSASALLNFLFCLRCACLAASSLWSLRWRC